ncbi:hypothetical protein ACFYY3_13095 [Streptomyces sp. NPDC001812]|uniref:Secreted protein n=1 Tax=Streptomyces cathayae TaxID=3031124 RepID=A0ABY8K3V0_9ACTN|nr:hypothetical protein [Streptomyces sp. HUAS 5]WGD42333.1 hypothetical protein PYS65_20525 [Streptomyces sp. HUAS 5]
MQSRGNALRLTAVAALVVLTLTGFSTGRGRGGGDGGGGGGCSSSSQDHDSSRKSGGGSHRDYDDDDYDDNNYGNGTDTGSSSGGSPSSSLRDATVELLSCASKKAPYATVRVTNPNTVDGVFSVVVDFEDRAGRAVASSAQQVAVAADDTATARVKVGGDRRRAAQASVCDPDLYAPATR